MTGNEARVNVLGVGVNATSMERAASALVDLRRRGEKGYVCVTSVHGVMESQRDEQLRQIHNASLMTVPDGMPTVWMGREYGFVKMGRVYGPDLMLAVCKKTAALNQRPEDRSQRTEKDDPISDLQPLASERKCCSHFLYGATDETLQKLEENLRQKFPGIQIVGSYAPPFRPLTDEEELALQQRVAACRPDFFWVGLSTPKQEKFMASHSPANDRHAFQQPEAGSQRTVSDLSSPVSDLCKFPLDAGIFLGVGAAFDIHAGNYADAPEWIKNSGLQWFYRFCKEPRRLWRRYLWIVPGFLWLASLQLLGVRKYSLKQYDR